MPNKRTIFARLTAQGTAASETALCSTCFQSLAHNLIRAPWADGDVATAYMDCSGNEALQCQNCGYRREVE